MTHPSSETESDDRWYDNYFVITRWLRMRWKQKYVATIDHADVAQHVRSEGRLTSRYSFMVTMSCAIAMLGLLLSSPAVVIGAMLISPLMGPIMSLGFSLCLLDIRQMRKALEGVAAGVGLALAISWSIVSLSPLTDATPEILARTQPNFFDLLVAIFSGMAGGYAVVKRKGETIVGVAIATALMPPLAVVGFGLATGNGSIYGGAFMLFMTNLLAIALSVTLVAKFYGFGSQHGRKHTVWQTALIACVFGALSLPLGIALKNIAYQTYVTKTAKAAIGEYFGDGNSRISLFNISFPGEKHTTIDTVILTPSYKLDAQKNLQAALADKINAQVDLSLDQVVVAKNVIQKAETIPPVQSTAQSVLQPAANKNKHEDDISVALKAAAFFDTEFVKIDTQNKRATVYAKPSRGVNLSTLHQFESRMITRHPDWHIQAVPPAQPLPFIYLPVGKVEPAQAGLGTLEDIVWALNRWGAKSVVVVGFASTVGEMERFDNTSLAYRRARHIADLLEGAGITAEVRAEYRSFRQRRDERDNGTNSFQRVEIRLNQSVLQQQPSEESTTP